MAVHSLPEQCAYIKHSLHIVNPLIAPHINPFLPSALVQCQCFFLALITVLVSLGMSVTPSQFPPVSECPPKSRKKSLIAAITSRNKNLNIYTAI
ncbi:unnamed protein product [Staurois parvus]|uniref:Uncharacterized protein n=1 Tax=Staurois parvus TaxID=386267 RepID=A0ABN9EYY7_9NEOB|nr:unnamed protein product [Staurois parvus]